MMDFVEVKDNHIQILKKAIRKIISLNKIGVHIIGIEYRKDSIVIFDDDGYQTEIFNDIEITKN